MKIVEKKYVIATKSFPLRFDADETLDEYSDGEFTDILEDAHMYKTYEQAEEELENCFDDHKEYQIIEVKITYEF